MADTHFCGEHNTPFLLNKFGRYGHPIKGKFKDGKQVWCNEPKEEEVQTEPVKEKQVATPVKPGPAANSSIKDAPIAPQERGMWWKIVGDLIVHDKIDVKKPAGQAVAVAFYAEMRRVLGVYTGMGELPKKSLKQIAKEEMGAEEITEEVEEQNIAGVLLDGED